VKEITLVLTVQELDTVMQCVVKAPYEMVHGVVAKILNQANSGQSAPTPPAPTPPANDAGG
jgi:hypothetical protein